MEQWQIEALILLFQPNSAAIQRLDLNRSYLHSEYCGENRYHVLSKASGDVTLVQLDEQEKHQQSFLLKTGEFENFLKQMLLWYLADKMPEEVIITFISEDGDIEEIRELAS